MKPFISIFILFFFISPLVPAQDSASKILSPENFIAIVKQFHPVIKQANINIEKAAADITTARGGFDPSIYLDTDQKTFDGKNYYSYVNPELKIPTWYGIEVKAGLENNGGQFLNSETSTGQSSYVGLSVPLAKNLLMDKRRAVLQQAKIFKSQTEAERLNIINDLLYNAYSAYWNWVKEYQVFSILTNTVKINETRFELIKIAYRQGDRPAIDTVEAMAQLQSFQFLQSESQVRLRNTAVEVSNFLWLANNSFYQLGDDVKPEDGWSKQSIASLPLPVLDELLYNARLTHPKLKMYNYKLQWLEVERKLKFQSLLPTVNVRANLLNKGYDMFNGIGKTGFYENNNKFGLEIGLPLRLSEGRGGYRAARLKIQETNLEISMQQQAIENKVKTYYNELLGLQQQVKIYEAAFLNYQTLFRGEDTRFKAGESSLFLLNTRENKQLEAQQKLVELKTKYFKALQAVQWAAGQLR
ncbi:MAG TPA: TolC family protein [Ferruginibacter sp.]|nr:TolC family protein [Ferruginibacter sp.]HPH89572.1 TolC family protein [Ferruginibacter sp.]